MTGKFVKHCIFFNKEIEDLKNKQTYLKNTITRKKTTLEGINRITEAE